MIKGQGTSVKM